MRTLEGEQLSGLIWEVLQTANRLIEVGNGLSAPFGLSAARWQVLSVAAEGPASVAEIARRLSQARQGVQRLADELVREGLAQYSDNPRHRRAKLLAPSERGADAYGRLMAAQAQWVNALAAPLDAADVAAARKLLVALRSVLHSAPAA